MAYFCKLFALATTFMRTLNSKCTSNFLVHMGRWDGAIYPLSRSHSRSRGVQKWPIWDQKWPNPFGPFQTKLDFLLQTTLAKKPFVFLRRKIDFCLKRSKMVQMAPNGLKWSKTCYIDHLGPFWTTSGHWQAFNLTLSLVSIP